MADVPREQRVIVVLGGALGPDGGLPPRVVLRLQTALSLRAGGYSPRIIVSGKGAPRRQGPLTEAQAMRDYLLDRGVPPEDILTEERSVETIGNLYFTRVLLLEGRGWRRPCVVTSAFHMRRVKVVAAWVLGSRYAPSFAEAPDGPMTPEEQARRAAQEAELLRHFRRHTAPQAARGDIARIGQCLFPDALPT